MPVPVSVTGFAHKAGALSDANPLELPSAGPFNRAVAQQQAELPPREAPVAGAAPAAAMPQDLPAARERQVTVRVNGLNFSYPDLDGSPLVGVPPLIEDMRLELREGDRCLLLGPNGAGKTTLLRILGGKHMVPQEAVTVLGRPVFHDTALVSSGDLTYIGGNWQRDVAFAGYAVPLQGDFPASKMLNSVPGVDEARKQKIIEVLDVDVTWRMHKVSDGQRRRVQLAYGLLKPFKVLLLDEITVDLDVLGRADLMQFLKEECETRGATVIYVTHIFDGLEGWATRLAYVADRKLQIDKPIEAFPELAADAGGGLLELLEGWLREHKRQREEREEREGRPMQKRIEVARNNGWAAGRNFSTQSGGKEIVQIKNSSNAVLRC